MTLCVWGLQADELRALTELAQEAGGILWEMAAMQDTGEAAAEMLSKSEQLQVSLSDACATPAGFGQQWVWTCSSSRQKPAVGTV